MTQFSISSIPWEELEGSPTERMTPRGFHATRNIKCAWAQRLELCRRIVGGNQGALRFIPWRYPEFRAAFATSASPKPFGSKIQKPAGGMSQSVAMYDWAEITIEYEVPDSPEDVGPLGSSAPAYAEEQFSPYVEFMQAPSRALYWGDGTKVATKDIPGRMVSGIEWSITYNEMKKVPTAAFELGGHVNNRMINCDAGDLNFATETLLFGGPRLSRSKMTDGSQCWRATFTFSYKPEGWNQFYKTAGGDPEPVYTNPAGTLPARLYPLGDFGPIIDWRP